MATKEKPRLLFTFAHPDDDAFGPAGSLIKFARDYDIYFLCATKGESGTNHSEEKERPIQTLREKEVVASSQVIGAKGIHFLGFTDGDLSNNLYHQLAERIQHYVDLYQPEVLLTWEPRGVSGHIDHIVVSMVTHYVFERSPSVKSLYLYCKSESQTRGFLPGYFIYRPPGYPQDEIDLVVDVSDVWEQKKRAMECHKTQVDDMRKILARPPVMMMEDCYMILQKDHAGSS